jgi:hypothetical protein
MEISREQVPVLYLRIGMRKMFTGISLKVDIFLEDIKVELAVNLELFLSLIKLYFFSDSLYVV